MQHDYPADVVRRSPADEEPGEAAATATPIEIPEHVSPAVDALAQHTAEQIDDVTARDWKRDLASGFAAAMTAQEIEGILADVFEQGHTNQPQIGESNAPVLQYYVGQHPGLRERLALLRRMAGSQLTLRIGRYLAIPVASGEAYHYQIKMWGLSGGEGVEGTRQVVSIRYLEGDTPIWVRKYDFIGVGPGGGWPPLSLSGDVFWNDFYAPEYWSPDDFIGPMTVVGGGVGVGLGGEVEGATFVGNGEHASIGADIGGLMWSTPEIGGGGFSGGLLPWMGRPPEPAPDPGHGVVPREPPYVRRPSIDDQLTIEFATGKSHVDEIARSELGELAAFVSRWRDVFDGGLYKLQLIGHASRTGSELRNQQLSEERRDAVRTVLEGLIGHALDDDHYAGDAVGEEWARLEGRDEDDDSAEDRVVEVSLRGQRTVPI
jgi:outer membrane protein OmpA-like peptidoglycan-associated protein